MNFEYLRYLFVLTLISLSFVAQGQAIEDEALDWLQAFLQVDTINPPGNETRAVEFIANILEAEGIPCQTAESAPGRGNIWARLEGGDEPGLILLNHTDVVPADPNCGTSRCGLSSATVARRPPWNEPPAPMRSGIAAASRIV